MIWNTSELSALHPAMPQPFLLLIAANLAKTGFLGWKWSLWSVPAWLAVQRRKAVFFLVLYDSINDMKYFWNCLHHTSAVPQPFLLLIATDFTLRSEERRVVAVALHLSCATSFFVIDCCQFGPSWMFGQKMELMACAELVGGTCQMTQKIWRASCRERL